MRRILFMAACAAAPMIASAKVELPSFFTDSMVIQRNSEIKIPGTARKNATVKITPSWNPAGAVKVKAGRDGHFEARIATPDAGGPHTITFDDGKGKLALSNILSGDVWFCSGQSNMEMPVNGWGKAMDYRREIARADYPEIRLLQVKKVTSCSPQQDVPVNMGGWRSANTQTVGDFSAIGYFFGREINKETGVPVGIIDCTWGGTPIEAWSSYETLKGINEYASELADLESAAFNDKQVVAEFNGKIAEWNKLALPDQSKIAEAIESNQWKKGMPVPCEWEKSLLPDFDGVVMLRYSFDVPSDMASAEAVLHLACVDDEDITYINGVKVAEGSGFNSPRSYRIPAGVIVPGKNTVTVVVTDTGGGGGIWGNPDDMYLQAADKRIPLAGDWEYSVFSDFAKLPPRPISPLSSSYPTVLYNAMMHPITTMPVKGILWYQGCANVGRDQQYAKNFKAMINDWRKAWDNPELPFYFVQLAGYLQPQWLQPQSDWAALRQAQTDALELPNTGMAVAIDLGNPGDIHPKNKQEVARRLALIALDNVYGKHCESKAPKVESHRANGPYISLTFDKEVMLYGGGQGFIVKGSDDKWALGYGRKTAANTIEVSSDEVADPVEIRYNWADYPDGDMRGATGLPVAPFKLNVK